MKFIIVLGFCLAVVSASPQIRELRSRELLVDTIEGDGRITNGLSAAVGQFPYQVGLSLKMGYFSSSWCGGSLISPEWVLTAAHCTDGAKGITVYLGATVRSDPEVVRTVDKSNIFIHPGWDEETLSNDISLIKISPVSYTDKIKKIELPALSKSYPTYIGEYGIASGWGRMNDRTKAVAEDLQYGRMKVVANEVCEDVFGTIEATLTQVCAATPNRVSTCQGDSGGPFVVLASGKPLQIGLTSFGASMGCEKGLPVVFTRVTCYLDWIKSISGVFY